MDDFDTRMQRKAETHLDACNDAMHEEGEGRDVESPAYGPYDGCTTCIVREVLSITWEEMLARAREEAVGAQGWHVPGGGFISDTARLRIVPPPNWHRVTLALARVPPSMNTNEVRSHWSGFQKEKKSWQDEIEQLLMVEAVRRDGYQRAMAGAYLRFPRGGRRDTGNFAHVINKALGDALGRSKDGGYGAIPDDDERRYFFGGVEFDEEPGPPQTRIVIYLQPKEQ